MIEEPKIPEPEAALVPPQEVSEQNGFFSFVTLFENVGEFPTMMDRFEKEIAAKDYSSAQQSAKGLFGYVMSRYFPKDYQIEENEAFKVMALNLKFRRFLRFKSLLDARKVESADLLYMHHFLTDLYLSIKEL